MAGIVIDEGTAFLVPTRSGEAVGIVSRVYLGNVLIAHFFPPESLPSAETGGLRPSYALTVLQMGTLGFTKRGWPLLGPVPGSQRQGWEATTYVAFPSGFPRPEARRYADAGIFALLERLPAAAEEDRRANQEERGPC